MVKFKTKYLIAFGVIALFTSIFFSCQKEDINGDLDGNWQMTEWKDIQGNVLATNNTRRIFYTIKLHLLKMQDFDNDDKIYCHNRFHYTEDSLFVDTAFLTPFDSIVPLSYLEKYGCTDNGKFAISLLNRNKLTLRNSKYTLQFRRF